MFICRDAYVLIHTRSVYPSQAMAGTTNSGSCLPSSLPAYLIRQLPRLRRDSSLYAVRRWLGGHQWMQELKQTR